MDAMLLLKALILGTVEGLTDFLPISSTGHLILAGDLRDFNDDRGKLFEMVIQSGAFVIIWAERREHRIRVETVDDMSPLDALKLGIAQAFALIPGTSRSGATIIGGLLFGLSRKASTEFSFFLAIPTLFAATAYNLYKERALLNADDLGMWAVGFVSAFVSAFLCVRWLLRYISSHDFTAFAWYRIVFGIVVLATAHFGWVQWTAH